MTAVAIGAPVIVRDGGSSLPNRHFAALDSCLTSSQTRGAVVPSHLYMPLNHTTSVSALATTILPAVVWINYYQSPTIFSSTSYLFPAPSCTVISYSFCSKPLSRCTMHGCAHQQPVAHYLRLFSSNSSHRLHLHFSRITSRLHIPCRRRRYSMSHQPIDAYVLSMITISPPVKQCLPLTLQAVSHEWGYVNVEVTTAPLPTCASDTGPRPSYASINDRDSSASPPVVRLIVQIHIIDRHAAPPKHCLASFGIQALSTYKPSQP
ncbi:uncharacterized protein LAESUDRAFT_380516 [Laetiporus sulphureus 93-53]|uniref:Uncharacterized protein n=1 Tax=Laetiporus sulphureus 93-53 TaxID=1314785 RepID=A0A165CLF9_9APHY|nr:uncharacterized protein LAESUDRAFT_380516 [Laetiporus sulphureus 93-53]KZT03021.1 hypothetical protein LAESUDRAFT_380516 [Laetiporus sulphureus 93-53]